MVLQRAFPNPDHSKPLLPKLPRVSTITFLVPSNLCGPVFPISLWYVTAGGTAMPKTTVDKYHNPFAFERKIG